LYRSAAQRGVDQYYIVARMKILTDASQKGELLISVVLTKLYEVLPERHY